MRWKVDEVVLYINDVVDLRHTSDVVKLVANHFVVGADMMQHDNICVITTGYVKSLKGEIADLNIWNRSLTEIEIHNIYASVEFSYDDSFVAWKEILKFHYHRFNTNKTLSSITTIKTLNLHKKTMINLFKKIFKSTLMAPRCHITKLYFVSRN